MRFFFPDAHDYVDPDFDFIRDRPGAGRSRYHSDRYAHEILERPPYDGLLVSKSIVDGHGDSGGKYTTAQRQRLYREGVHRFFRVQDMNEPDGSPFPIMGDCGAFSYVDAPEPPVSVEDVLEFYETCGFTHGQSVDHVILAYNPEWDAPGLPWGGAPPEVRARFDLTLRLAEEFLRRHGELRCRSIPVGVAQGWSPDSYLGAVMRLQEIGYTYIALGGMVPLKTPQVLDVLRRVMPQVRPGVSVHILGVIRWSHVDEVIRLGVASFDSTSPLRQAFLDESDNYYLPEGALPAVRIPQMDGNARLKRRILAGELDCTQVRTLEQRCLEEIRAWAASDQTRVPSPLLDDLDAYLGYLGGSKSLRAANQRSLSARPWRDCACCVCRELKVEVLLFRGANRNRRRGFHNLHVAYERLQRARARVLGEPAALAQET